MLLTPVPFFSVGTIVPTDDGDAAPSAGTGTAQHTYTSLASTGPHSIAIVSWLDAGSENTLSSATWGGSACSIIYQVSDSSLQAGLAFVYIEGAQTGDLVLNFSGTTDDSEVTVVSLTNLASSTAEDTDTATAVLATSVALSALSQPSAGGIRLTAVTNSEDTIALAHSNTELADLDMGNYRHGVGYDQGTGATVTISNGDSGTIWLAAGVSLR